MARDTATTDCFVAVVASARSVLSSCRAGLVYDIQAMPFIACFRFFMHVAGFAIIATMIFENANLELAELVSVPASFVACTPVVPSTLAMNWAFYVFAFFSFEMIVGVFALVTFVCRRIGDPEVASSSADTASSVTCLPSFPTTLAVDRALNDLAGNALNFAVDNVTGHAIMLHWHGDLVVSVSVAVTTSFVTCTIIKIGRAHV